MSCHGILFQSCTGLNGEWLSLFSRCYCNMLVWLWVQHVFLEFHCASCWVPDVLLTTPFLRTHSVHITPICSIHNFQSSIFSAHRQQCKQWVTSVTRTAVHTVLSISCRHCFFNIQYHPYFDIWSLPHNFSHTDLNWYKKGISFDIQPIFTF